MADAANSNSAQAPPESIRSPATGPLAAPPAAVSKLKLNRDFLLRAGELGIFLAAIVGAVALGLGITTYFFEHAYIAAYLLAYAGFRCADLLVRAEYGPDPARDALARRLADQLPLLVLFASAPFERTYLYGGEPQRSWSGFALLLELLGLWLALGARIQLEFFSAEVPNGAHHRQLVRKGFYRFVRHPIYAGVFVALIAWPIAYGAPISLALTIALGSIVIRRTIRAEERALLHRYGDEYASYQAETDALIPALW